tara:strand:+ start:725 stop:880 length:156 start_codon:yes stop_codon:yes gene_type:complete
MMDRYARPKVKIYFRIDEEDDTKLHIDAEAMLKDALSILKKENPNCKVEIG